VRETLPHPRCNPKKCAAADLKRMPRLSVEFLLQVKETASRQEQTDPRGAAGSPKDCARALRIIATGASSTEARTLRIF